MWNQAIPPLEASLGVSHGLQCMGWDCCIPSDAHSARNITVTMYSCDCMLVGFGHILCTHVHVLYIAYVHMYMYIYQYFYFAIEAGVYRL